MNDQTLMTLLEHTADQTPVGPAPLAEIARGARRRQQRRLVLQTASSALVGLVLLTGALTLAKGHSQGNGVTHQPVTHPNQGKLGPHALRIDGTWKVHALVAPNGTSALPRRDRDRMSLTFHNGHMTGSTTCNTITGRYIQSGPKGQDLKFLSRSLTTTLVGCAGEPPLLATLRQVRHLSKANGEHYLHADNWMILVELSPSKSH